MDFSISEFGHGHDYKGFQSAVTSGRALFANVFVLYIYWSARMKEVKIKMIEMKK